MIQQENKQVDTDQAWRRLYGRLEQDGLLAEETPVRKAGLLRLPAVRWAAAIIIICISAGAALLLSDKRPEEAFNLLTLHNEKGSVTLVTTLEDGSIVYLADDTQLQYPEHFAPGKREVSLKGNALFDVSGNKERPFLIETEAMRIEVIGTAFNVQSTGGDPFELSVQRGEVKVTYKQSGESRNVKAGETVTLLSSNRLHVKQTNDNQPIESFTGRIRFKDERLGDILNVINKRTSGIELQTTASLANNQLTATFDNESPEMIAELICTAFNLSYKKERDTITISEP